MNYQIDFDHPSSNLRYLFSTDEMLQQALTYIIQEGHIDLRNSVHQTAGGVTNTNIHPPFLISRIFGKSAYGTEKIGLLLRDRGSRRFEANPPGSNFIVV
jgi:hypothetical protein